MKASNNNKNIFLYAFTLSCIMQCLVAVKSNAQHLVDFVKPLTGTAASTTVSAKKHGEGTELLANTIPAVTMPFAMTQFTAQTRTSETKCVAPYYYKDSTFSGVRATHWISGSCMQDYGSVTIMPVAGKVLLNNYASTFSHANEVATPYCYTVKDNRYNITTAFTATKRCGYLQSFTAKKDTLFFVVSPNSDYGKAFIKIDVKNNCITGYNPVHRIYQGWGQPAGFSGYFIIRFNKQIAIKGVYQNTNRLEIDSISNQFNIGAIVGFTVNAGEKVECQIGTSFTSVEAAAKNLAAEINVQSFAQIKEKARTAWENQLHTIEVATAETKHKYIFYTAMYHAMQHPRLYSDVVGTYPVFAGNYQTAKLVSGNYYDDFSMWDIYRTQLPLLELLDEKLTKDFVNSLLLKAKQGGWLPNFPCWNSYTSAMVGDHAVAFIASAIAKNIKGINVQEAYGIMRKNAFEIPAEKKYKDGRGRRALSAYVKHGYYPLEDSVKDAFHKNEQVSRTLEYAYDDACLAIVAKLLHKKSDYGILQQRGMNYKNVFDSSLGFMNGRYSNGNFYKGFAADKKMFFITEGTARQYSFYVPQDVEGLIRLNKGPAAFERLLDSLFIKNEYWHGNEPGQQIPFLYNYTASPYKTQQYVNEILRTEYDDGPGGLSGNDDAGQVSAWYVMASVGLYPIHPAGNMYAVTKPLFSKITIHTASGKQAVITSIPKNKTALHSTITVNGKTISTPFITHQILLNGGTICFK